MSRSVDQKISEEQSNFPEDIPAERVQALIHSVTVRITQQVAQINLQIGETPPYPEGDLCAVYTTIDGTYHARLILCAERLFLQRMTENMPGSSMHHSDDLEEYSKEFFNILCGRIVGEICQANNAHATFQPPRFTDDPSILSGSYRKPSALICFTSDRNEKVVILHDELQVAVPLNQTILEDREEHYIYEL